MKTAISKSDVRNNERLSFIPNTPHCQGCPLNDMIACRAGLLVQKFAKHDHPLCITRRKFSLNFSLNKVNNENKRKLANPRAHSNIPLPSGPTNEETDMVDFAVGKS